MSRFLRSVLLPCLIATASFTAHSVAQTNFDTVAIGHTVSDTVTVTLPNGGTIATISVLLMGAPNMDFTDAGTGSCTAGTAYAANATCTVEVDFKPIYPGARFGAVVLADASTVLGTAYVQGIAMGPQAIFQPVGTYYPCYTGASLTSIALDGEDNVYLVNGNYGNVGVWVPDSNGVCVTPPTTSINVPAADYIAVDGAGNLYLLGGFQNQLVRAVREPDGSYALTTLSNAFGAPGGVTLDGAGNVYVANGAVYKETLQQDGTYVQSTVQGEGEGGGEPATGIAVDGQGNVYVDEWPYPGGIYKNTPSNGGYTQFTIESNAIYCSQGIALDAHGDIYIADAQDPPDYDCQFIGVAKETMQPDGSYAASYVPAGADQHTYGISAVAVDAKGDLFYAGEQTLDEVAYGNLPSLSFAPTNAGLTSTDSPQTISVTNDGNADLIFSAVHIPAQFTEKRGVAGECTASTSLSPGTTCTVTVEFEPTEVNKTGVAIPVSGNVTITANTLNAPGSKQAFPVSASITTRQDLEFDVPATVTYGVAPIPLNAKGGASGNPVTYTVTGPGRLESNTLKVRGVGTIEVTASQAGTANYGAAAITRKIVVEKAPLVVAAKNASREYGQKNPALGYTFSGFVDGNLWIYATAGKPVLTTTATESSPPGKYPIKIGTGTLTAPNYRLIFKDGTLTVKPK